MFQFIESNISSVVCSGPHTISLPWKYRTTSVGVDIDGCSTKLSKQDEDGNGEVRMTPPHLDCHFQAITRPKFWGKIGNADEEDKLSPAE